MTKKLDNSKVVAIPRAKAPTELTPEQALEWVALTNRMPSDYFGAEHIPVMVQWCRHIVAARVVAQLIEQELARDELHIPRLTTLYKQQEVESRAITALSRTMRLTHQSNIDAHTSRTPPVTVDAPWVKYASN
jgi:hypothetical protein